MCKAEAKEEILYADIGESFLNLGLNCLYSSESWNYFFLVQNFADMYFRINIFIVDLSYLQGVRDQVPITKQRRADMYEVTQKGSDS